MNSSRVWYLAHLGATIALAVLSAVSVAFLVAGLNLPPVNSFGGVIIFAFVVPGVLLVFSINHLILWRRKPRVIRTPDKVVLIVLTVIVVAMMLSTIDEEFGFGAVFFVVPLVMLAGPVSTIILAVGNGRARMLATPAAPVEPGTAPVAATLDQLFPQQPAPEQPAAQQPAAEQPAPKQPAASDAGPPASDAEPPATPYGPKA